MSDHTTLIANRLRAVRAELAAAIVERDMVERRGPNIVRGERQGHAKLTDADVIEIRRRRAFGEKTRDIANAFGISNPNVTRICLRHNWKHV